MLRFRSRPASLHPSSFSSSSVSPSDFFSILYDCKFSSEYISEDLISAAVLSVRPSEAVNVLRLSFSAGNWCWLPSHLKKCTRNKFPAFDFSGICFNSGSGSAYSGFVFDFETFLLVIFCCDFFHRFKRIAKRIFFFGDFGPSARRLFSVLFLAITMWFVISPAASRGPHKLGS